MARSPLMNIRVDAETKARWETAARDEGLSLAEFVRVAVDERLTPPETSKKTRKKKTEIPPPDVTHEHVQKGAGSATRAGRAGMCEHRIPATSYCPKCDP